MHDVIIIGGSYAGLAAALQLGRARRSVLVIDSGRRRNRFAASSHGFLGQDGATPESIAAKGRAEVLAYPTVQWRDAAVDDARIDADGFVVRAGGEVHHARRLVLATGVHDELPAIPGIAERWGSTIFHCPYCHGYELGLGRLGVLASGPPSFHSAALVAEWGARDQTTLFLHDAAEPDTEQLADLEARGIRIERERVAAVEGEAPAIDVRLQDGRTIPLDGLFVLPRTRPATPFAEQLGCELDTSPTGIFYKTDMMKATTVPGVFACGDAAMAYASVALVVGDGVRAGLSAHQSLVFGLAGADHRSAAERSSARSHMRT